MQRRSIPRTDPRYNQVRTRNNDSVKKSREKSRRERDETLQSINELEDENEQLIKQIELMKQEYQQMQDLFQKHTGLSMDQLMSSQPKPVEETPPPPPSKPVLTINTNEDKSSTASSSSDVPLDPNTLDGAIVLINGLQYKIMNHSVDILVLLLLTFPLLLISSQESPSRKKQDFYCSACKSMSETIFHEMNDVDPNERVQVGSYRVDGHGHQKLKEVPIIETRYHAENVLDNVCSKSIRHQNIPTQLRNLYEHACDDILEEHHDSLIDLLVQQNKNIQTSRQFAELFCLKQNQYCQVEQFEELYQPIPTPEIEEEEEQEKSEL